MSAFLVGTETIDRILTALDYELRQDRYFQIKMEEKTGINYESFTWKDDLGTLMLNMNQMALGERYNDKMIKQEYKYSPKLGSNIQNLKSLQCFTYQCAEGVITKLDIYKFFDQIVERKFMVRIIYSIPEYDQAMWA